MFTVVCLLVLTNNTSIYNRETVHAVGRTIQSAREAWIVDFGEYFAKHPEFKKYNNEVIKVDSNNCAIIDGNAL